MSSFSLKSVIGDFAGSMLVQVAYGGGDFDRLSGKAILSLSYAAGRIIYNWLKSYNWLTMANTATGLAGFAFEVGMTTALFYVIGYLIGYEMTVWYALLVALGSATLSDKLSCALEGTCS